MLRERFDKSILHSMDGKVCWSGSDLKSLLGYTNSKDFSLAIETCAKDCKDQGINPGDVFKKIERRALAPGEEGPGRKFRDFAITSHGAMLLSLKAPGKLPGVLYARSYFSAPVKGMETILKGMADFGRHGIRHNLMAVKRQVEHVLTDMGRTQKGELLKEYCQPHVLHNLINKELFDSQDTRNIKLNQGIPTHRNLDDFLPNQVLKAKYQIYQRILDRNKLGAFSRPRELFVSVRKYVDQARKCHEFFAKNERPSKLEMQEDMKKVTSRIKSRISHSLSRQRT